MAAGGVNPPHVGPAGETPPGGGHGSVGVIVAALGGPFPGVSPWRAGIATAAAAGLFVAAPVVFAPTFVGDGFVSETLGLDVTRMAFVLAYGAS